jgi:hypothetical protein
VSDTLKSIYNGAFGCRYSAATAHKYAFLDAELPIFDVLAE